MYIAMQKEDHHCRRYTNINDVPFKSVPISSKCLLFIDSQSQYTTLNKNIRHTIRGSLTLTDRKD